jgi:ribonuclease BN (tRNA processing enzyme)
VPSADRNHPGLLVEAGGHRVLVDCGEGTQRQLLRSGAAARISKRRAGEMLHINVLGLAPIAQDVAPDLARSTIASVSVLGALHATPAVKAALSDRTR